MVVNLRHLPKLSVFFAVLLCLFFAAVSASTKTYALTTPCPDGIKNCTPATGSTSGSSSTSSTSAPSNLNCSKTPTDGRCATCQTNQNDCVQCTNGCGDSAVTASCNHDGCDLVGKFLNPLIKLLSAAVGVVVVLSIIYGAIQYSSSAGDPQKAAKARGHITKTVLALVAYIFFFAFLQFIVPGGVIR